MSHYTYLFLLLFTLSYPLYKSFEDRIRYYKKWEFLWPALIISAIVFIAWDIWFTYAGVWRFNPDYVLGYYLAGLPLEEWCFFFIIPFSCVFIYEVLNYFVKKDVLGKAAKYISIILILLLLATSATHLQQLHTAVSMGSLGICLLLLQFAFRVNYLGRFYLAWAVCMIPFLLVNGVLTAMPVLIYNNLHILNIRIYTIPVEDIFYGMLNILLVISVYEYVKKKQHA
jgi:lycopene cyclase domain-containing protein